MRKLFTLFLLLTTFFCFSQTSKDYTVQAWVIVDKSKPSITIKWQKLTTGVTAYEIYRKTEKYYAHIEFKLIAQRMIPEKEKKVYDHIKFEIECVPEEIFEKLSELAKDPDKLDEVWKIHEKEKLILERECFFDITSFYGRNNDLLHQR